MLWRFGVLVDGNTYLLNGRNFHRSVFHGTNFCNETTAATTMTMTDDGQIRILGIVMTEGSSLCDTMVFSL